MLENDLALAVGSEFRHGTERCFIAACLSLTSFLLIDVCTGGLHVANLHELSSKEQPSMADEPVIDCGTVRARCSHTSTHQSPYKIVTDARGDTYEYAIDVAGQKRELDLAVGSNGFIVSARITKEIK